LLYKAKRNTIKHLVKVKDKKWLSGQGRAKLALALDNN
jgi:hypothetical protein